MLWYLFTCITIWQVWRGVTLSGARLDIRSCWERSGSARTYVAPHSCTGEWNAKNSKSMAVLVCLTFYVLITSMTAYLYAVVCGLSQSCKFWKLLWIPDCAFPFVYQLRVPDWFLQWVQVDYTGFTTINPQRFGQKFVGKVGLQLLLQWLKTLRQHVWDVELRIWCT